MRLQVSSYGSPYIIKFFPCSYICAVRFTFVNSAFWFEFDHNKRMDNSQKCFMEFDLAGRALPIISQITTASAVLGSLWVLKSRLFTHPNFGYRADPQKHDEPFCFLPCAKSEHNTRNWDCYCEQVRTLHMLPVSERVAIQIGKNYVWNSFTEDSEARLT